VGSRTGQSNDTETIGDPGSKNVVREYTELILVCVLFVIFMRAFVFQQSEIPSGSMEDTILIGDYILVNRFAYAPTSFGWENALLPRREIRRGDVVVFRKPDRPEIDFIKRVVGLPGDTVTLVEGFLYVNGVLVDEPHVGGMYRAPVSYGPVRVDGGHFFMMGDHRNASSDSREWGQVPGRLIKGQAFMILFSTGARVPPGTTPGQVTPMSLGRKIFNLVFRARWDRALRTIH
jgi:signal peptidase I